MICRADEAASCLCGGIWSSRIHQLRAMLLSQRTHCHMLSCPGADNTSCTIHETMNFDLVVSSVNPYCSFCSYQDEMKGRRLRLPKRFGYVLRGARFCPTHNGRGIAHSIEAYFVGPAFANPTDVASPLKYTSQILRGRLLISISWRTSCWSCRPLQFRS